MTPRKSPSATTKPASTEMPATVAAGTRARRARGRVRLLPLGHFDEPTYLTAPRGDSRRFVVERGGRIRVVKGGRTLEAALPRHLRPGQHGRRERPALDGLRAGLRPLRALLRLLHGPAGLPDDRAVPALAGQPRPGRPGLAPDDDAGSPPALQPQGRPGPVRPGRAAVRGLRRRRWRRRSRRQRAGPRRHPREDGSHRAEARRRLLGARRQPVRGPLGCARRDLRLRPAQPVPLLVRPRQRRA